jgi:hypothetical protein
LYPSPLTGTEADAGPADGDTATMGTAVIRPIEKLPVLKLSFVNHRAPSGPATMPHSSWIPVPVNDEVTPAVVILPISVPGLLVNQSARSGPEVTPVGASIGMPR